MKIDKEFTIAKIASRRILKNLYLVIAAKHLKARFY